MERSPREPGRVGDHAAPLETALGGGDLFRADDEREGLEWVGITGVIARVAIAGPPETFDGNLGRLFGSDAELGDAREVQRGRLGPARRGGESRACLA